MHLGGIIGGVVGATGGFLLGGPPGAAAGWSAGSSIGGGLDAQSAQQDTNAANVRLAEEQMAFQDKESSTAYQRATQDMQKAGLNPMLAYSQGGASTPGGAMPVMQNPVAVGTASAAQAAAAGTQVAQLAANVDLTRAQTLKTLGDTLATGQAADLASADINLKAAQGQASSAASHVSQAQVPKIEADTSLSQAQARLAGVNADTQSQVYQAMTQGGGFSADVAKRVAEAKQSELQIPELEANAKFYTGMGNANPFIKQASDLFRLISIFRGATSK